jgi:hypothetical protein
MRKSSFLAVLLSIVLGIPSSFSGLSQGTVVAGSDVAILDPQQSLPWEPYENVTYRLKAEGVQLRVETHIDGRLGESRWELPASWDGESALERTARNLSMGASTVQEAVVRILSWIAREIRYSLARTEPQDPWSVLDRRSAYCTGTARLAVALLRAIGIEAREVPGFVFEDGEMSGFHRWIEVYYPGVGWAFSDPRWSIGFVPATYLRLSSEEVEEKNLLGGHVLLRENWILPVDIAHEAAMTSLMVGLTRVKARQRAALRISAGPQLSNGVALLMGQGTSHRVALDGEGRATFLDLVPGEYFLKVASRDGREVWKRVIFRAPIFAELEVKKLSVPQESP